MMTLPSPPEPVEGHVLQVETGLQQLMGDRELYLQILRRFRQRYPDSGCEARTALDNGEPGHGQRIVHTLKGAAGMIGAQQVYLLASRLEPLCAGPAPGWSAPLAQLELALRALITAIDDILDGDPQQMLAVPADHPGARAHVPETRMLLLHLARLLDEGDGAAIDVLEQSATVLAASLGVEVFQEVTEAAHQFDFEAALATLQAAMA
ncbi:HPt (histidine-containing phosphotransfer) domain-containing protein [Duganella sp. CF402]|uniref:Hpt domain-containing protein n=1 Tax=unclassified Duganella TaxID=2636909 RepID=UPI0008C6414E|nr:MULTISPECIES: Hpt domain-containing protein [unclassified Duganella]RZT05329.1 HPt (histidine-containing phosphotransfer) domain-containing protein [Duganella sp. BK701]SEN12196.1 HPt (histidine-containing phosphotransfer) domain-containing protein [Duganella sp. CF402]